MMTLSRLATIVSSEPTVAAVLAERAGGVDALDVQAPEPLRPFLTAALAEQATVVAVTATAREGEELTAQLGDRKSTRLNSSHCGTSRMPSSA